jgi:hypothetical protein
MIDIGIKVKIEQESKKGMAVKGLFDSSDSSVSEIDFR